MSKQKTAIKKAKSPPLKIFIKLIFIFNLSSCVFFHPPYQKYLCQKAKQEKNLSQARLEISSKKSRELFKKSLNCLSQKAEPELALLILETLLKKALQAEDYLLAKEIEIKLAPYFFYVSKDYNKALKYYSQLLKRSLGPGESFDFQYHIADSFFQLKKADQALLELEKTFFKGLSLEQEKKAFFLKLSILIFQKNFATAEILLQQRLEEARFKDQDLLREQLALVYESQKAFLKAIEELKKIKTTSPFVEQKIKRLKERQINQPGF